MGISILLALFTAAFFVVLRTPNLSTEVLVERWAQSPSRFVVVDGLRVHLRDEGPIGALHTIVMLHGAGTNLHVWAPWVELLKGQHRIVTFDLPGFGLSDPFRRDDYDAERYVEFVGALLHELELENVTLVGRAFGGEIAWRSALQNSLRVRNLILLASAGYPIDEALLPFAFRAMKNPLVGWMLERYSPRGLVAAATRNAYGDPEQLAPAVIDCLHELMLRGSNRRTLTFQRRQLEHGAMANRIRDIGVPTLIMWGQSDRVFPPEIGRRFASDISDSELVIFEGLGHLIQLEAPALTAQTIIAFLEK